MFSFFGNRSARPNPTSANGRTNLNLDPKSIFDMNSNEYKNQALDKITDPSSWGVGCWYSIHTYAMNAKTDDTKKAFMDYMKIICTNIKCENCRGHATEYLEKHPIKDFHNIKNEHGEDIGMFKWTYLFHNAVNSRLGKPQMLWETAYSMYSPTSPVCVQGCGEDKKDSPVGVTASTRSSQLEPESVNTKTVKTILNGGVVYSQRKIMAKNN